MIILIQYPSQCHKALLPNSQPTLSTLKNFPLSLPTPLMCSGFPHAPFSWNGCFIKSCCKTSKSHLLLPPPMPSLIANSMPPNVGPILRPSVMLRRTTWPLISKMPARSRSIGWIFKHGKNSRLLFAECNCGCQRQ